MLSVLLVASCGDSDSGDVGRVVNGSDGAEGVEWVAGERFSSLYALQVLESPAVGAVVVDTATEVDGVRRVQVRWQADGEDAVVTDLERPALVFPWAWMGADRVYVAGYVCSVPSLDDIEVLDVDRVAGCGGRPSPYSIRVFDWDERSWSEVDAIIPLDSSHGVDVQAVGASFALFGGGDAQDPSVPVSYRVDLETGAREVLSGDAEGISTCESGGVQLGFRGGEVDANGRAAPGKFARVLDDSVQDLDAVGDGSMRLGCLDDAMVLWAPEERSVVLARYSAGSVTQERVSLPAGPSGIRLVNQRNLGQTVAVWEGESTDFQLWQLRIDGWERCGLRAEGMDPPKVVAVAGCEAITANPTTRTLDLAR